MSPVVVNRHHLRAGGMPSPHVYIGRGTPLGNEVSRRGEDYSDEEAIERYERWLWGKVEARDESVLAALNAITPAHSLVCSCAPRPCHGDAVPAGLGVARGERRLVNLNGIRREST